MARVLAAVKWKNNLLRQPSFSPGKNGSMPLTPHPPPDADQAHPYTMNGGVTITKKARYSTYIELAKLICAKQATGCEGEGKTCRMNQPIS